MKDKIKRIEELKKQKFNLDMIDRWDYEDRLEWESITKEIKKLELEIYEDYSNTLKNKLAEIKEFNKLIKDLQKENDSLKKLHEEIQEEKCIKCVFNYLCTYREDELRKILNCEVMK